jgi:hypothetical protein
MSLSFILLLTSNVTYLLSRATLKDDMKVHVGFKKKFGCESMQYTKIWLVEELLMYTLGLILKQVFESNFCFIYVSTNAMFAIKLHQLHLSTILFYYVIL